MTIVWFKEHGTYANGMVEVKITRKVVSRIRIFYSGLIMLVHQWSFPFLFNQILNVTNFMSAQGNLGGFKKDEHASQLLKESQL